MNQDHTLWAKTTKALADLAKIRSNDPAAAHAIRVIRLTEHTLATHWMPSTNERTAS